MTKQLPLLRRLPHRRISPFDGMAITADVWREAHEYHQAHQRLHSLYLHGSGIVTGLEVIAGDPPGQSVYILPGIAIDPSGNTIVVSEPVHFDLGRYREGILYLILTYDESPPQSRNGTHGDEPLYVYTGYNIEAVPDSLDSPQVELARIKLRGGEPVVDAKNAAQPGVNEIDQRFRRTIGPTARETLAVGVAYLSRMASNSHGRGFSNLARAVNQQGALAVRIDESIDLAADVEQYGLIALVAKDAFQVEVAEVNALYNYVRNGGTLFVESCRREGGANPASDTAFADLVESLGVRLRSVTSDHDLLQTPHLFTRPPVGYETQGAPVLRAGGGVIFSTYDYGCIWRGDRRAGPAEREAIRSAMEWGENLLHYAAKRRRHRSRPSQEQIPSAEETAP